MSNFETRSCSREKEKVVFENAAVSCGSGGLAVYTTSV
jgi:hypothetical protein